MKLSDIKDQSGKDLKIPGWPDCLPKLNDVTDRAIVAESSLGKTELIPVYSAVYLPKSGDPIVLRPFGAKYPPGTDLESAIRGYAAMLVQSHQRNHFVVQLGNLVNHLETSDGGFILVSYLGAERDED